MTTNIIKLNHNDIIINFTGNKLNHTIHHSGGNTYSQRTFIRVLVEGNDKHDDLISIRNAKRNHVGLIYSYKQTSCISADYAGKKEEIEARIKSVQEAPLLSTGDVVEINGTQYSVYVNGSSVSDPVSFERVDGKCEYTEALKEIDPTISLDSLENYTYDELLSLRSL